MAVSGARPRVDWRTAGAGALLALAVALPPALVVRILKGNDASGRESNLWVVTVLAIDGGGCPWPLVDRDRADRRSGLLVRLAPGLGDPGSTGIVRGGGGRERAGERSKNSGRGLSHREGLGSTYAPSNGDTKEP